MTPRVSICVPNLNTRPFLPERFQTIRDQTFQDYELLVYDSYSNDGAWEYITELAASEPRLRAWQGPREGTPGSWNPCIRAASGEYVYIATSDDTMPPDCLEKLVAALDANRDCDIAHCRLRAIDEHGHDLADWWAESSLFARSSGPWLHQAHVRKAPFDGLLHLVGATVYISITQLLLRRSLFDRIGLFEQTWGSIGDFDWSMRAGLAASTVHVPDTWGGWRVHPTQATAGAQIFSAEHSRRVEGMIEHALQVSEPFVAAALREPLRADWAVESRAFRLFERAITDRPEFVDRRSFILRSALKGSRPARAHLKSKLLGSQPWSDSFPARVQGWLAEAGLRSVLSPAAGSPSARAADESPLLCRV